MLKLEVIKKSIPQTCWACSGVGCKVCDNTGKWKETINYIIYEKDGIRFGIDSDNIG